MNDNEEKKPLRKVDLLKKVLSEDSVSSQFRNALGTNSTSFAASLIELYSNDTALRDCDVNMLVKEALKAAVLKLPITKSLGFAYIVPYSNSVKNPDGSWSKVLTPTFIPGYKGIIQLAMRTGQYRTINADVVYDGEIKTVNKLTGEIKFDGERKSDKVVGYFAYFELLNGFSKTLYMTVENVAKHAKRYSPVLKKANDVTTLTLTELANKETNAKAVGWLGNFEEMAIKTCLRGLLSTYGYLSVEMIGVLNSENESETQNRDEAIQSMDEKIIYTEAIDVTDEEEVKPPYA